MIEYISKSTNKKGSNSIKHYILTPGWKRRQFSQYTIKLYLMLNYADIGPDPARKTDQFDRDLSPQKAQMQNLHFLGQNEARHFIAGIKEDGGREKRVHLRRRLWKFKTSPFLLYPNQRLGTFFVSVPGPLRMFNGSWEVFRISTDRTRRPLCRPCPEICSPEYYPWNIGPSVYCVLLSLSDLPTSSNCNFSAPCFVD